MPTCRHARHAALRDKTLRAARDAMTRRNTFVYFLHAARHHYASRRAAARSRTIITTLPIPSYARAIGRAAHYHLQTLLYHVNYAHATYAIIIMLVVETSLVHHHVLPLAPSLLLPLRYHTNTIPPATIIIYCSSWLLRHELFAAMPLILVCLVTTLRCRWFMSCHHYHASPRSCHAYANGSRHCLRLTIPRAGSSPSPGLHHCSPANINTPRRSHADNTPLASARHCARQHTTTYATDALFRYLSPYATSAALLAQT